MYKIGTIVVVKEGWPKSGANVGRNFGAGTVVAVDANDEGVMYKVCFHIGLYGWFDSEELMETSK